jgi:hypothetical protein
MNAYELAEQAEGLAYEIPADWSSGEPKNVATDIADMLRQQADRITELEDRLSMYEIKDLDRGIIGKIGDCPIHDLVHRTTPQIKELSDDEIEVLKEIIRISDRKHPLWDKAKEFLK